MQTYDFLMIAVLAGTTVFGFVKGMAWQIASLASLILSYFVALRLSPQVAPVFGNNAPLNRFVAMLVIYILCSFAIWLLFRVVSNVIDRVRLKEFDRQLGALLGFAKGVLFCVAITFFAVTLLPGGQKEDILASRSGHYIGELLSRTRTVVPDEVREVIGPYLDRIEQGLDPNQPTELQAPPAGLPQLPGPQWSDSWPNTSSDQDWSGTWPNTRSASQPQDVSR